MICRWRDCRLLFSRQALFVRLFCKLHFVVEPQRPNELARSYNGFCSCLPQGVSRWYCWSTFTSLGTVSRFCLILCSVFCVSLLDCCSFSPSRRTTVLAGLCRSSLCLVSFFISVPASLRSLTGDRHQQPPGEGAHELPDIGLLWSRMKMFQYSVGRIMVKSRRFCANLCVWESWFGVFIVYPFF